MKNKEDYTLAAQIIDEMRARQEPERKIVFRLSQELIQAQGRANIAHIRQTYYRNLALIWFASAVLILVLVLAAN